MEPDETSRDSASSPMAPQADLKDFAVAGEFQVTEIVKRILGLIGIRINRLTATSSLSSMGIPPTFHSFPRIKHTNSMTRSESADEG